MSGVVRLVWFSSFVWGSLGKGPVCSVCSLQLCRPLGRGFSFVGFTLCWPSQGAWRTSVLRASLGRVRGSALADWRVCAHHWTRECQIVPKCCTCSYSFGRGKGSIHSVSPPRGLILPDLCDVFRLEGCGVSPCSGTRGRCHRGNSCLWAVVPLGSRFVQSALCSWCLWMSRRS